MAVRHDHSFPEAYKGTYGKIFLSSVDTIDNEAMLSDNNSFSWLREEEEEKKKRKL
jgi:hypothetical protein